MRSRHRKQRLWQGRLPSDSLEDFLAKEKGVTVGAVTPSKKQPVSPYQRALGVTLGTLSNVWPTVKSKI